MFCPNLTTNGSVENMDNKDELTWHNDGHAIYLSLQGPEVLIQQVTCPGDGPCTHRGVCIVDYFISRYGFECNIGSCEPAGEMEICWAVAGNPDRDFDEAQLWFVPINDEVFYAWMTSRLGTS